MATIGLIASLFLRKYTHGFWSLFQISSKHFLNTLECKFGAHLYGGGRTSQIVNYHAEESVPDFKLVLQSLYLLIKANTHSSIRLILHVHMTKIRNRLPSQGRDGWAQAIGTAFLLWMVRIFILSQSTVAVLILLP